MNLADVKVGERYVYTNDDDPTATGRIVVVTDINDPESEHEWPIEADFDDDGVPGLFWAHELRPVVTDED